MVSFSSLHVATKSFLLLCCFCCVNSVHSSHPLSNNCSPTVTIPSGVLVGTTTALPSATAIVNQFLGIPFAAPPLRFAPPEPPKPWKHPLDVTSFKPSCVQQFSYPEVVRNFTMGVFNNPGGPPPLESEDCLTVNVYAPSTPAPPGGRTVMFWIYGGGFRFGTAGIAPYSGASFAAYQDVVLVAANYRTNAFGFSNSPQIPLTSRNSGFLDQRLALAWVQSNIKYFGGDPKKVTIFGESAGAFSVDRLVTTFPHNPPFRAAILQSGQASINQKAGNNDSIGLAAWDALAASLHCSAKPDVLACVRSAPASKIKDIIEHAALNFDPITDNFTQLFDPATARAERRIANVPILAGTDAQEGRVFVVGQNNLTAFLATSFPGFPLFQQAIAAAYPVGPGQTDYDVIAEVFTDFVFQCPAVLHANASATAGYPTWRYYFNASFANTQAFPGGGVYHGSEISIVFGTYPRPGTTAQENALSQLMQGAWANFAKNPLRGPGWNPLGTFGGVDLGVLGADGGSGVTLVKPAEIDKRCGLYAGIYAANTL